MFDSSIEFQKFIENKMEDIIYDIERKNLEYARYMRYLERNSEKYEMLMKEIPTKERDFINEFNNNSYKMNIIERKEFYYRGYIDCIKLLKLIGMI